MVVQSRNSCCLNAHTTVCAFKQQEPEPEPEPEREQEREGERERKGEAEIAHLGSRTR